MLMAIANLWALIIAMLALALVPSASVFAVMGRTLTSGFWPGAAMALGIALGDCIFILLAVTGLSTLAEAWSALFTGVKIAGAGYLLFLGVSLWRVSSNPRTVQKLKPASLSMSLLGGLLLTLGDPKAIVFYVSFFPAFVNLANLGWIDLAILWAIAVLTVGGSKMFYAFLTHQSRQLFQNPRILNSLNRLGSITMITVGLMILLDLLRPN